MSAIGAIALGLAALAFKLKATINAGAWWAIKVALRTKQGRDDDSDGGEGGRWRAERSISISQTMLGTLGGLLVWEAGR